MNRQRLILTVVLGLLVLAIGSSIIRFPRQKKVEKQTFTKGSETAGVKSKATVGEETRVRLDLLQKNQVGFTGFKKNIFIPIFRDISKLPPVKPVIPALPPPPPPPPVVAQPTVSPLERELAQFTFLGFLEKEKKKTVFLTKNKEIFLVKKGERIAEKYEAVTISNEALTIRVLGGDSTEIIIPLIENQSLKAPPQAPAGLSSPSPQIGSPQQPQIGASPQPQQGGRISRRPLNDARLRPPGVAPPATEPRPADE